jgi:hypothetical protein
VFHEVFCQPGCHNDSKQTFVPILFAVHSLSELGKDDFPANERTNKAIQPATAPCYTGILCDPLARLTLPLVLTVRLSARVAFTPRGFKVHFRQSQHFRWRHNGQGSDTVPLCSPHKVL